MKMISITLILINFIFLSEDSILPKNENGLIYFEEEIIVTNVGKEALFSNALKYASTVKKENKKKSDLKVHGNYKLEKKGSFLVYTQGLLTPQIHGEITYNIQIQVFENGYRYTFSNFVFNYYQRTRYGKYAPVGGKYKRLEEEKFAGMQKTWLGHKQVTKEIIENQITNLKNKMLELPPGANTALNKEQNSQNQ